MKVLFFELPGTDSLPEAIVRITDNIKAGKGVETSLARSQGRNRT
jgi:hypothetical protein